MSGTYDPEYDYVPPEEIFNAGVADAIERLGREGGGKLEITVSAGSFTGEATIEVNGREA